MKRYPFAPLAALMECTENAAARRLGVSGSTMQEYRTRGMSELVADRMAVKAGFHPCEVWPDWLDDNLEDVENKERRRRAENERKRYRKSKARTRKRKTMRAYHHAYADHLNAQRRRRYAENIDRERAKARERYRKRTTPSGQGG